MAKLTRISQKVFGEGAGATGITEYGSPASGSPIYSTDAAAIQTDDWLAGWAAAALAGSEIPTFQDFNGIHYVSTRQIAYLLQEGLAEYDTETEYHQNSIVKKQGTYELYGSLVNDNTGNALPSQVSDSNWQYLLDLAAVPSSNLTAITDPTVGDDDGDGYSVGSFWVNTTADTAFICVDASTGAAVWLPLGGGGGLLQVGRIEVSAVATGAGVIPADDTIPQSGEGAQFITGSFTPQSATSTLYFFANVNFSTAAGYETALSVFEDSETDAFMVGAFQTNNIGGQMVSTAFTGTKASGSTSSRDYKLRIGTTSSSTITLNGRSGSRRYGGSLTSSITILEVE